ncbi:MAG: lipid-A-disaccharide synthase [Leptolyngbya sp. IPPAS B-1204]|uniref:Lipid-A-disaccharide synthase n=1 Tax=Leptolyngbya sp. NK1-12 TaxID=2547451 RepID=A0AA96WX00_9CYAN|nr:lipid-A-disaccharide synthase [Leptolyngbya sp. NK1-12]RNJ67073.1 MAG: lipid-A-disaccharide synthase [Leptolyngbya sp. IPPAS B-1204]WNZ25677.1 lipid-A-disaccharide synthase [Leptolyngbya sp. NK1-12]
MALGQRFNGLDVLILSNGPGELTTWVRPVVKALRQQIAAQSNLQPALQPNLQSNLHPNLQPNLQPDLQPNLQPDSLRISLILSPCANASGQEAIIARTYPEIDRVQAAEHFFPFLLWGKTAEDWDWAERGLVIFLGGDQFFPVVIGKRLGYKILIYAEWETRWHRWVDRFAVMNPSLVQHAPAQYADKLTVVGDLMADVHPTAAPTHRATPLIGLLPGSKPAKLAQGVPLALAVAQQVQQSRPDVRFVIPVAPTLDLATLARFANPAQNPVLLQFGNVAAELVWIADQPYLKTQQGLPIELWTQVPAYDLLVQCDLCLTTVGANTAELGALAIPMIVLIPTQQLDAMRAWDGLPGLLANLPGVGTVFAKLINRWFLRQKRLLAWPNIWAGAMIVPELIGQLHPRQVADMVLDWLDHPEQLAQIRQQLQQVRGETGAAQKVAELAQALLQAAASG